MKRKGLVAVCIILGALFLTLAIIEAVKEEDVAKAILISLWVVTTGRYLTWKKRTFEHEKHLLQLITQGGFYRLEGNDIVRSPLPDNFPKLVIQEEPHHQVVKDDYKRN